MGPDQEHTEVSASHLRVTLAAHASNDLHVGSRLREGRDEGHGGEHDSECATVEENERPPECHGRLVARHSTERPLTSSAGRG